MDYNTFQVQSIANSARPDSILFHFEIKATELSPRGVQNTEWIKGNLRSSAVRQIWLPQNFLR